MSEEQNKIPVITAEGGEIINIEPEQEQVQHPDLIDEVYLFLTKKFKKHKIDLHEFYAAVDYANKKVWIDNCK